MKRKICVITGSRSEYGLLYWLIKEIQDDPDLELQLLVTGIHLSPEFGMTYKVIEKDGFVINAKVEMQLSSDSSVGVTKSMGLGLIGYADALDRLKPDIVVLMGDRYEIMAAAQAAMVQQIPVAHISGGEVTEGAIDDSIRHAVTKMSHLHIVAAEPYRKRTIQLGEHPDRVYNFGEPGLDNINKLDLLDRKAFEESINFKLGEVNFLVTYHPVTLSREKPETAMQRLFDALDSFDNAKVIFTKPNADTGGRAIIEMIDAYGVANPKKVSIHKSLGQIRYLSAMVHCDVVVGNSSSGLVEVPVMKKPTVNIGDRQKGRLKAKSVIDCPDRTEDIIAALQKGLSKEFQLTLPNVESFYGDGRSSEKIKEVLKSVQIDGLLMKRFFDV